METDGNKVNNDPNSTSESARPTLTEQNVKDVRQGDALGGELMMSVSQTGDATGGMRNPPTTDTSLSQEVKSSSPFHLRKKS